MKIFFTIIGSIFLGLVLLAGILFVQDSFSDSSNSESISVSNDSIASAVRQIATKSKAEVTSYREIAVDPEYALSGGTTNIMIELKVANASGQEKRSIELISSEIYAELFQQDKGINTAWISVTTENQDILKTSFDRELAETIDSDTSAEAYQYDVLQLMKVEKSTF